MLFGGGAQVSFYCPNILLRFQQPSAWYPRYLTLFRCLQKLAISPALQSSARTSPAWQCTRSEVRTSVMTLECRRWRHSHMHGLFMAKLGPCLGEGQTTWRSRGRVQNCCMWSTYWGHIWCLEEGQAGWWLWLFSTIGGPVTPREC